MPIGVTTLRVFDRRGIYFSVMSNENRLAIMHYLLGQTDGDYLSGIAKKLGQNKGAVFKNLNILHRMGGVDYEWRVVKGDSPPRLVKYYYLSPKIPTNVREDLRSMTHFLCRLLK